MSSSGQDRYSINVHIGSVEAIARDDTGVDSTIIPAKLPTNIFSGSPGFEAKEFDTPLQRELAVFDKCLPKIIVKREIRAPLTITLAGCHLLVRVPNVRMLVSELDMNTLLLPTVIRFSVTKYLAENYVSVKQSEVSAKAKTCSYTSVIYSDQNVDPTEPHVNLSEQFGENTAE